MKKKLFAMLLSLVMILSSVSILSEVSFAEDEVFGLNEVHTIAKANNGKYYAARYYKDRFYGKNVALAGKLYFYEITEGQYNAFANDCFMIFKNKDKSAFEIPEAIIATNDIIEDQPRGNLAGAIFTELQFMNNEAYYLGLMKNGTNRDITTIPSQQDDTWLVELKKDWVIKKYSNDKEIDQTSPYTAFMKYNIELDGNGHTIYKEVFEAQRIVAEFGNPNDLTQKVFKAKVKNLTIDGAANCKTEKKPKNEFTKEDDNREFGHYECIELKKYGELELENVTLQNGYLDDYYTLNGGGIRLNDNSKLTMDSKSKIINCRAPYGGAIRANRNVTLIINGSSFIDNSAELGGAICSSGKTNIVEINNATFENNKSEAIFYGNQIYGGAIYTQSKTTIDNSTFKNNSCENAGGAIVSTHRDTVVKNSTFNNNEANWGGAIANYNKINISNSSFDGNIAKKDGGAISTSDYKYENNVDATKDYQNLTIDEKTTFTNNKAKGYFNPPENVKDLTNIKFKRTTFTGTKKINPDSPLNNYDINYKREIVVTYDPNDGNEAVEDKQKEKEVKGYEIKSVKDLKFTNTSKFLEWNTKADGTGTSYQVGDKVDLTGNLYLYAIWEKPAPKPTEPTTLILTLDENHRGGEITNIEVEEGDLIEPHLYIPRRRGYIFKGWSYDRKHLDEVKPGDRIYSDTTLYAIWKRAEEERVEEPIEIKGEDHITYIFGYPDGSVRPNGSITRAEAAAMLARLLNIEAIGSAAKPQFTDTESSWYNKAINAVVFRGIMKGYPDGRFRPNAPITRAEFTQMISTIDNKPYGVAPFADVLGHWAERAIGSEYQAKRITGYPDGLFRPDANITRAEAAVILNKIFERKYDNLSLLKCKNPQMIKRFTDLDETFWGWNDMVEATNSHEYVRRYKEDVLKRIEEDWLLIK
ncbi:S-layer homology domain-containing protein [Fenollaria timonensis]|uniref:S-layer homology domain-containing protein n=1 Tax=Fenollaria timonensis TaxID=1723384 RepID=UPI0009E36A10|nr:S-layer homology domain-containing protein [Fenollaria timonensis]